MREYKFRAKIKKPYVDKWVYGYLVSECYISEKDELGYTPVRKETVGQYTGLHDKNGKEIYEGDILQIDIEKAWVMWNERYGYFELVPIGDYYFDSPVIGEAIEYTDPEVIGNIYENEELLNETNR